ncbi:hypothetical protein DRE_03716 [Drechslerella stenobrocha 248]|uniref:Homeobox domain-containing protein n=1 Tax=Drechslerella stenobrocha 248 TaxID=1043628 RepID=W7HU34_9PEZI|nr:hypothetical protein DRE_03716 [Drechslerella stenobrocha 248]
MQDFQSGELDEHLHAPRAASDTPRSERDLLGLGGLKITTRPFTITPPPSVHSSPQMEDQDHGSDTSPVESKSSITLPPLLEAIPEFRSHTPSRKSASKPRGLTSLISPTALPPHLFGSPVSPGRTIPNAEVNLGTLQSPKRRRLTIRTSVGVPYPQTEAQRDELRGRRHLPPTPHSRTASVSGQFQLPERSMSAGVLPSFPQMHQSQRHYSLVSPRASNYDIPITPASSDRKTFGGLYATDQTPIFTSPFEKDRQYQSASLNEVLHSTHQNPNIMQHKLSPTSPNPSMHYAGQMYSSSRMSSAHSQERTPFSTSQLNHPSQMDHSDPYDQLRGGKRRRGNLPKQVTDLLRNWLHAHLHHPYPTEDQKLELVSQTGLTMNQISNWFINARRRRLPAYNPPNGPTRSEMDTKSHLAYLRPTELRSGAGHQ